MSVPGSPGFPMRMHEHEAAMYAGGSGAAAYDDAYDDDNDNDYDDGGEMSMESHLL